MEKKYFFFDIDGTLTDRSTGEIVPSAREALNRLEENGHLLRSQQEEPIIKHVNLPNPMDLKIWYAAVETAV